MSSFDMEPVDEAQFDAFLQGKDELSQLLRKMPQPKASRELDASILAMVASDFPAPTPETAGFGRETKVIHSKEAANEVSFWQRWKLPMGLAASFLLAIPAVMVWQQGRHERSADVMVAAAPQEVKIVESPAMPAPEAEMRPGAENAAAAPVAPAKPAAMPTKEDSAVGKASDAGSVAPEVEAKVQEESKAEAALKRARAEKNMAVARAEQEARQLADAKRQADELAKQTSSKQELALADAPHAAKKAKKSVDSRDSNDLDGKVVAAAPVATADRAPMMRAAPPPPVAAAAPAAPVPAAGAVTSNESVDSAARAKAWLKLVEELLKANMQQEAVEEWIKFRKIYPQYPVDQRLQEKMKALQQK